MIIQKTTLVLSALIISALALTAQADTKNCPRDGKSYKDCLIARSSDRGAKKYLLTSAGQLRRITDDNAVPCTIDQDVIDMKVSQHHTDSAVLYYSKKSKIGKQLIAVTNADGDFAGKCLKVKKEVLMDGLQEYKVVSAKETTIINAALSTSKQFKAWDSSKVVYQDTGVKDFQMNSCFGQPGKSFSSYVLFTIDNSGIVNKVQRTGGRYVKGIADNSRFQSLNQFSEVRNVCK